MNREKREAQVDIDFHSAKSLDLVTNGKRVKECYRSKITPVGGIKMNSIKYLNVVLTVITILLIAILLQNAFMKTNQEVELIRSAYAQAPEIKKNILFSSFSSDKYGNKFLFVDLEENIIYVYDSGGKLEGASFLKMGEDFE